MPDISMCANKDCPLRESCYRFKAEPGMYQTYSSFEYKDGECEDYWELETDKKDKDGS